jgi:hypothetical protein
MVLRDACKQRDGKRDHVFLGLVRPQIARASARALKLVRFENDVRFVSFGNDFDVSVDQLLCSDPIRLTQRAAPSSSGSASSYRDKCRECGRA